MTEGTVVGYTHYWYRPVNNAGSVHQYTELRMDAARIISTAMDGGIEVRGPFGVGQPQFSEERFAFNGDKENDFWHETFSWKRYPTLHDYEVAEGKTETFDFCKTAYKPYDAVVCAVLIRAKEIYGDLVRVKSDGNWGEWASGRKLYELTFGREATNPMLDPELV